MREPPSERGAPTAESAPHQAVDQDRDAFSNEAEANGESHLALTVRQALAFGAVWLAAQRGLVSPTNDELLELTGFNSYSSPHRLLCQLQRRRLITVQAFQKGRQVHVLETGKSTAPPNCKQAHWRHRSAA